MITKLIWDGNSKSYKSIVTADPYLGTNVEKVQCIGNIKKKAG